MHVLIIALHITSVWTSFSEAILLFCLLRWGLPLDQSLLLLKIKGYLCRNSSQPRWTARLVLERPD